MTPMNVDGVRVEKKNEVTSTDAKIRLVSNHAQFVVEIAWCLCTGRRVPAVGGFDG